MKKITKASRAAQASEAWRRQYDPWNSPGQGDRIYQALLALGKSPAPDDVDRIIGNPSWTEVPPCNECGALDAPFVIEVGETPDYESATVYLCPKCVAAAAELSGQEESK